MVELFSSLYGEICFLIVCIVPLLLAFEAFVITIHRTNSVIT